ncbi:hypothetical protein K2O51_31285 (plasmid) [Cupriavidus pinatubonensis]|uniref:hypothetical protein n=1 Tax=Cupriavidus pinatubonensis TaxID=248026 RepID=UPI001C730BED|nr:hypothetical protein [Cupriavidus pinatubonensis]QYY33728.1 hypothetical protein K2O51_31285 [Cupriavidus pinatubonensis]
MGIASSLAKVFATPYIRLASESIKAGKRVKSAYQQLQDLRAQAAAAPIIDADDERAAFEALFVRNQWTPEQLIEQRRAVVRAKWAMLATTWALLCLTLGVIWFFPGIVGFLVGVFGFGLGAVICAARMIQYALFQSQIDLRALITFRAFLARPDFFSLLFLK